MPKRYYWSRPRFSRSVRMGLPGPNQDMIQAAAQSPRTDTQPYSLVNSPVAYLSALRLGDVGWGLPQNAKKDMGRERKR